MNKVILLGRLTKSPEIRYSQGANPVAVARYGLAVRRQFKKDGQPDVDFINIVAFGKAAEFAEKYFQKGQMVAVTGRLQLGSYVNKEGVKVYTTDVIVEEQHFAESKVSFDSNRQVTPKEPTQANDGGFTRINEQFAEDEDLPF